MAFPSVVHCSLENMLPLSGIALDKVILVCVALHVLLMIFAPFISLWASKGSSEEPKDLSCQDGRCVRKCCGEGKVMEMANDKCVPRMSEVSFRNVTVPFCKKELTVVDNFEILFGLNCPSEKFVLENDEACLTDHGDLLSHGSRFDHSKYCLEEYILGANSSEGVSNAYFSWNPSFTIFMCLSDHDPSADTKFMIYPVGMIFSVPFLIITLLVYAVLPDLHNLDGVFLLCYVFCLLVADVALISSQTVTSLLTESRSKCFVLDVASFLYGCSLKPILTCM
ncbi:hypothetical protein J6590_034875 [Homalodisca vitripennis]|nr:hypothetical protein J6590_034875 [Homalodisca vitripennis]